VTVAVAVLLNAQFTWSVLYSLRENRERLELERTLIETRAEVAALRLQERAEQAAWRIMRLPAGVIPPTGDPFPEIRVVDKLSGGEVGWVEVESRSALAWPLGGGRQVLAFLDPESGRRWLSTIDPTLHLVDRRSMASGLPRVLLPSPFDRLAVAPDAAKWNEVLLRYQRRVVMAVVEGLFFLAGMVGVVILLWRVLRREGVRERQHENFVSAITHELKTPLAGIRLALETVLRGRVDAEGSRRFLSNALADVERLSSLVQKVLEVTRYAGGAHRLRVGLGDLSQLVEDEVAAAERHATARGVTLDADVPPGILAPFDPEALSIVISNLVENALKYAQGSPPRVQIRLLLDRGEAVVEVEDDGVGIAAGEIEAIFRPFYRASDEVTRRTPGTGIGLYVAREIVVAHGGKLAASSPGRGRGSVFRLVLPGASLAPEEDFSE
jgi:signal transduction histidine kinase